MADILLTRPAPATVQTVPSVPDGHIIFQFPADAALLTRENDDLVLTFEDGASIRLQNFYTTYSKDSMPSFEVDGAQISGEDFFTAMNEPDLMPAAGPSRSSSNGNRFHDYTDVSLLDGLDRLGGLDVGWDTPQVFPETDGGAGLADEEAGRTNYGVTITPNTPSQNPDDPDVPVQGDDLPPTMPHDVLHVQESALQQGSGGGQTTAQGSMTISAPDGVAIITINGVVVWQNGALTSASIPTDEGALTVTDFDGSQLSYTYTLTQATQEHGEPGADAIAHEFAVVVTDADGDSGSAVIRVEITDDVPSIQSFTHTVTEGDSTSISGDALSGAKAGADGADFAWTDPTQEGKYGTVTLNANGTYSYTLDNNNEAVKALSNKQTLTEEFTYTYTDADGDLATGSVTITINGVNNGVAVDSATLTVHEAGLDGSSQAGQPTAPTTASGSLHIDAPDGVATITIGGVDVWKNGALTGNTRIPTDEGALTVTGFDAATGELKFTYTLNKNTTEHGLEGMNSQVSHDLAVTVTDVDNSTESSVITVTIVDDVPSISVSEDASGAYGEPVAGSVDMAFGADGEKGVTVRLNDGEAVAGVKGTDGKYTFTFDDGSTLTLDGSTGDFSYSGVPASGTGTSYEFTFTVEDADGDTATATTTATITATDTTNLAGSVTSSDTDVATNTPHPVTVTDLPNGAQLAEGTYQGQYGTITVDASGTATYKQTGLFTHSEQGKDTAQTADTVDVTVTLDDGSLVTMPVHVAIEDDVPVLTAKIDPQPGNAQGHFYDTDAAIVFRLAEGGPTTKLSDIDFGADVGTGEKESAPARITVTVNGTEFTVTVTRDAEGKLHFSGEDNGTITFAKTGAATSTEDGSALTYDTTTGNFTYTRPTADVGGAADNYTFTLTVTDADGDTVQQTGSVETVFREPTITGDAGSTSSTVTTDEGNLEQGSGWETNATYPHEDTASGELTVNLDHADGTIQIGNLTIDVDKDGKVVSVNGKDGAALAGEMVTGDHGHLSNIRVSEADADGNITIHYTYTLTDAVDGNGASGNHPADGEAGRGESMQADNFTVTVTANGQTATGSIMANALDDAPRLDVTPEATSTQNDTTDSSLSGTFTVNFGADGPSENAALTIADQAIDKEGTTTLEVDGGTLTIRHLSGGTYAYTYEHAQSDVTFGEKTFAVVATDGDKDTTQAIITVGQDFHPTTDNGNFGTDQIHEVVTTDESYMEGGSQAGQEPPVMGQFDVNLHGENAETSITITHDNASICFTYDGTKWSAGGQDSIAVIHGTYGELSVQVANANDNNVTIVYEYKQTAPYTAHDNPHDDDEIATDADKFDIEINDGEDTPLTGSISVNIRDDAPSISVTGLDTAVDSGTTAHGSWTHSFGADLPTTQTITVNNQQLTLTADGSVEVQGNNGTLTVYANGSYTYTARPNTNGDDSFTFRITDADGDSKDATLTVAVHDSTVTPEDMIFTTQDADVAAGKASMPVPLAEGVTLTPEAVEAVNKTITYGKFSLSEDGKNLIFTQNSAYTHGEDESSHTFDQVSFAVTDANGNKTTLGVTVTITDDVPSISVDQEASGAYGEEITGSVDINFGADTGDQTRVTVSLNNEEAVEGVKGADGNYTFTFADHSILTLNGTTGDFIYNGVPASGTGTSYTFTFTVEDADGDTASVTTKADIAPKASYHGTVTSSDNDMLATTKPAHSVDANGMPSLQKITAGSHVTDEDGNIIGTFTLSGGKLFFTQDKAYTHAPASDSATLPHVLTVTDASGNEHIIAVDVTIEDSLPYARNDTIELKERGEDDVDASGNVLDNDTESADGPTRVTSVDGQPITGDGPIEIKGTLGTLSIQADGRYTYTLNAGTEIPENSILREEFTYTITDADGDSSTAAALTILVGQGTVHVQESGIGIDENGHEADVPGKLEATGTVAGSVTAVEIGSTQYTDDSIPTKYKLTFKMEHSDETSITIETNYGILTVNKETGDYTFTLDDAAANPLPNGFEIHQSFTFTTTVDGVPATQEVVVVIEGTNDAGRLHVEGAGGTDNNQLWMDAKAEGADTVERPYDATGYPNLGDTNTPKPEGWVNDLGQNANGTARPTTWLPFSLEDPDVGDGLTFTAVFNEANNVNSSRVDMEGEAFVSYAQLLAGVDEHPLSMALSVELGKFQQNFTAEQLDNMLFFRNDYGIFVITNEAVDLSKLTNQENAQYWLTFLVDSDADVIRHMAEGTDTTSTSFGKILNFSFQVTDKTGNTVKTQTGNGTFADTNHVLVHVYGSNDTPEIWLDKGNLVVHDDDVHNANNDNPNIGDAEHHDITITYGGKNYTGQLHDGKMELWNGKNSITFSVSSTTDNGTQFTINNFMMGNSALTGTLVITVTDARGNSAIYHAQATGGQLTHVTQKIWQDGTDESENLYGGSGNDRLTAGGGNDSVWGGEGNDELYGEPGNDRLYGENGDDILYGGKGIDILVGGNGNDTLQGENDNDVLIGDGQGDGTDGLQSIIEKAVNAETFRDFLDLKSPEELDSYISQFETEDDGNDQLDGGNGDDLLFGMGGDDKLYGGDGNDLLFGGSGNDFLDGGNGADKLYGGAGNDILVYDANDVLIHGGSGIDFLVSNDASLSLETLLNGGEGKPEVQGVEVLITGKDALSLTSMDTLAREYGITVDSNEQGETLSLNMSMWEKTDKDGVYKFTGSDKDLTLELDAGDNASLQDITATMPDTSSADEAVQQQVFLLQNSNG